MELLKGTKLG